LLWYNRGYYRCSSSKGCPARKQVERSCVDPTMLVVTYSSDHNHPWPASRNNTRPTKKPEPEPVTDPVEPEPEPEEKFTELGGDESMITTADEMGWLGEMETTTSTVLESPIMAAGYHADVESALLPMREEDELLFADLGELPECSVMFRQGLLEERRRYTAPWCGTTSWGQKSQKEKRKREERCPFDTLWVRRAPEEDTAFFFLPVVLRYFYLNYFLLLQDSLLSRKGKEERSRVE